MKHYTEFEAKNRIKTVNEIRSDLNKFPVMLFATFRTNGNLHKTEKELKCWCIHLKQKEKMQIAAYGIHTKNISPHVHILITGFSSEAGRTASDLSFSDLQYHQDKWPRDAQLEHIQHKHKTIDYILNSKNAHISGFDVIMFDQKLIKRFREGKKLPENVARRKAGLPLVEPAINDPVAIGRVKARLKRLKKKNGNFFEIKQLERHLQQIDQ